MKKLLLVAVMTSLALGAQAQQGAKEESVPVQIAKGSGIKKCLAAVKHLSDTLLKGRAHTANCEYVAAAPDTSVFSCEAEAKWPGGDSEYIAFSLTPSAKGPCMGEYTRVARYDKDCRTVRESEFFSDYDKRDGPDDLMRIRKTGGSGTIHLMAVAGGCTVIRREAINGNWLK